MLCTISMLHVLAILSGMNASLGEHSFRDCMRLGKYSPDRSRALLVRFNRTCDVGIILSMRELLKDSHINIKPFMTQLERQTESILLKERRSLIDSGIDRRMLKVRSSRLYQGARIIGEVLDNVYRANDIHEQQDNANITNTVAQQTSPLKTTQVQTSSLLSAEVVTTAKSLPPSSCEVTAEGNPPLSIPVVNSSHNNSSVPIMSIINITHIYTLVLKLV